MHIIFHYSYYILCVYAQWWQLCNVQAYSNMQNTQGKTTNMDTLHVYCLTHAKRSLSFTHKHPPSKQAHRWGTTSSKSLYYLSLWRGCRSGPPSGPFSVYKPLKPCPTRNERPLQSVSNPVPIWASLPWASFAFVLWISKGQALHAPA